MARWAVLIDLSGTLHVDNTIVSGAAEALLRLRSFLASWQGAESIRFVTNTTKESRKTLLSRLDRLGVSVAPREILSSLTAAHQYLQRLSLRPHLLLEEDAAGDFADVDQTAPNAVVVGLAPSRFHFGSLSEALRLLLDGAELIAIHRGRYYQRQDGLALGPGPFVAALEFAADKTATVVGKPEENFFAEAIRHLGVGHSFDRTFMVGDDVRDDVGGAQRLGIRGILVRTGKYRQADEAKICPPPSAVVEDFPAAVEYIIGHLSELQRPADVE